MTDPEPFEVSEARIKFGDSSWEGFGNQMKLNHHEIKTLIEKYHSRAIELYSGTNIRISAIKNVQFSDEGAFVEAMVFIPKSELK